MFLTIYSKTWFGTKYLKSWFVWTFSLIFVEEISIKDSINVSEAIKNSRPQNAKLLSDKNIQIKKVSDLTTGDLIGISPGEIIPIDGIVINGTSSTNEDFLTGESRPIDKSPGDNVLAGSINLDGYLEVELCKDSKPKKFLIHRLIALQFIEKPDNLDFVDHIDRDRSNNNLDNLRWVTRSQNCRNIECKGYSWCKKSKKWRARYSLNYKRIHIGYYDTEEDARNAYLNAIKDL